MSGSGTQLALQRVLILGGATDAIAARDDLGGFNHRDVGTGHHLQHRFGLGAEAVLVFGLGQRQGLHAAADGDAHLARHDALGRHADTHQARGAHPVQGHARHAVRQTAGVGTKPADVVGLGALLDRRAHDHILDVSRLDAGALDHRAHHMSAQHRGLGIVERSAKRLGQRGTGGGDDDDFIQVHGELTRKLG
ncbi:hypothetical protein D3C81_1034570 [compost metagenome]